MGIETVIGLANQIAIEAFFAAARLVAGHEQNRLALRIEGEGHSPFTVRRVKRSSFIFEWRDPFSVSTRGRLNCGPNCWSRRDEARISVRTA